MADESKKMRVLDMDKEFHKLTPSQQVYVRKVERASIERAKTMVSKRRGAAFSGWFLVALSTSVYLYTMSAVKQETFLDEFDEKDAKKT